MINPVTYVENQKVITSNPDNIILHDNLIEIPINQAIDLVPQLSGFHVSVVSNSPEVMP